MIVALSAQAAAAAAPPPNALQVWVPAALSALATVVAGWLVFRSSRAANRTSDRASLAQQQLAWTQQAMTEAQSAKAEARQAMTAAGIAESAARAASAAAESATRRAEAAEVRLREVTAVADNLVDWIARVVRKAHASGINDGASPAVIELLRVINGGPPEITSDRLRRIRDHGGK